MLQDFVWKLILVTLGEKQAQIRVVAGWMYTALRAGSQKSVLDTQRSQLSFDRARSLTDVGGSCMKSFPWNIIMCFLKCLFFLM